MRRPSPRARRARPCRSPAARRCTSARRRPARARSARRRSVARSRAAISRSIAAPTSRLKSGFGIAYAPQPAPITSVLLSSSRLTFTSGIEPPVKPTTTTRPPSRSERRLSVKRSPPTGSRTRSTPPPSAFASSFHGAVGAHDLVGAGLARDALLLVASRRPRSCARRAPSRPAARPCRRRRRRRARAPSRPRAQAPARAQREVGRVVVEDQARALREVELVRQLEGEERGRDRRSRRTRRARRTRRRGRPAAGRAPAGALRTTPPTSLPGTNGSGGLNWYSPRVCSTSGNDTPAACTSTTTPPRRACSGCAGSGSGSSTSAARVSGPVSSAIWIARMRAT